MNSPCDNPRVSVVMPAYQDLRFIEAAVKSILVQTYTDFELIVYDDGSGRSDVFAQIAALDARIHVISSDRNLGGCAATNRAIAASRGEIIAKLDCDDLAQPTRLSRLVAALDADRELGLVGSWATFISETGESRGTWHTPVSDLQVRWTIMFLNPFCHSSVAYRRTCFDAVNGYNEAMRQSGDYEMWSKLLDICRVANIPETLAFYRQNPRGLTAGNLPDWRRRTDPLREKFWSRLGVDYQPHLVPHLVEFLSGKEISKPEQRVPTYRILLKLLRRFLDAAERPPGRKDAVAAQQIKSEIVGRVLASPAVAFTDRILIWMLCWRIDRRLALAGSWRWISARR
jgi:glycosyltransferase involved in cell wall biosynthesis